MMSAHCRNLIIVEGHRYFSQFASVQFPLNCKLRQKGYSHVIHNQILDGRYAPKLYGMAHLYGPSEVVSVGDTIEVYVKDIDTENHKVSLGYKKAEDNPWEQLKNNYPIGSTFHAPVVSLTKFGAFVRILPGVDGLVHISEISNDRVEKVSDALKVGDVVDVKLLDVDFDKKRISLSMKALLNDDAE